MCVYIYTHTRVHNTCVFSMCMHGHIRRCYMYVCNYVYISLYTSIYLHKYTHIYIHIDMSVYIQIYICICVYIYIRITTSTGSQHAYCCCQSRLNVLPYLPQLLIPEFPKIGDPNSVPQIVGSLSEGPQNKVPLIFGNSHI